MGGSVYFAVLVAIIGLAVAVFVSPVLLIPAFVVVVVALFAAPLLAAIGLGSRGGESAVPTTEEASYEPVSDPDQRRI